MKITAYIFLLVLLSLAHNAAAQEKGFEWFELFKIEQAYRHMPRLSFNMNYDFAAPAEQGLETEQLTGTCKMKGSYYDTFLDSVEYVQGPQYLVTVYYQDSVIEIADRKDFQAITLPLSDSLFRATYVDHITNEKLKDTVSRITVFFQKKTAIDKYEIEYNPRTSLLVKLTSRRRRQENDQEGHSGRTAEKVSQPLQFTIRFTGYDTTPLDDALFDAGRFITGQQGNFQCQPAFAHFKLIDNTTH